jgi:hypothetical protein
LQALLQKVEQGSTHKKFTEGEVKMQVIYWSNFDGCYRMTSKRNYDSYIQNARNIHTLRDVKTLEDVEVFINHMCELYNDTPSNYIVIAK